MVLGGALAWLGFLYWLAVWVANMLLCSWLAKQKNRDSGSWVMLPFFFFIVATIALAGAPMAQPDNPGESQSRPDQN